MSGSDAFDYESMAWGEASLEPGERTIAGFRLQEALRFLPPEGRVLELGCGGGRYLRALARARPALQLVGADLSARALETARRLAPSIEWRPVVGPRGPLPARDGDFDAVLALDVLEHTPDPDAILGEIHRVLRPGGVAHLHVPCEGDPTCLWSWLPGQRGARALKRRLAGHVQRFGRRELLARLAAAGLAPVRVRYSLHVLGNAADVGAFLLLAARARRGVRESSGELFARARRERDLLSRLVRAGDAALWVEARLLSRVPSWGVHVSARKLGP